MPKVRMLKFEMVALLSDSKSIMDVLQQRGYTELCSVEENEGFDKLDTSVSLTNYDRLYEKAQKAYDILSQYGTKKKSLLQSFGAKKDISSAEYSAMASNADAILQLCDEIEETDKEISFLNSEIIRYEMLTDGLKPWLELDIPMLYRQTENTSILIGTIGEPVSYDELREKISSYAPELEAFEIEIVGKTAEQSCVVAICCKEDREMLLSALRAAGFMQPGNLTKKRPYEVITDYRHEIGSANMKIEALKKKLRDYSENSESIEFLCDYYLIQKQKYDAINKLGFTGNTIFIRGFIPAGYADELKQELEARFSVYMETHEPDENDDVPILLKNNSFVAGVEGITEMYSLPGKDDIDPNPIMSFFYYALFGIMLSDAGYGLVMMLVTFFAKKKLQLSSSMKRSMDMFFYCGLSSVIWGALFGGWFGDAIPTIASNFFGKDIGSVALWFEPANDAIKMLLYSFLFGIIHLFAGLAARFYNMCKHHDIIGAFCDVIPVYIFVSGFAIFGAKLLIDLPQSVSQAGNYLLIAGAALIVLTSGRSAKNIFGKLGGGLYGLYNTTSGYLSDILSYSRLLALCLVTGVIANVINLVGTMPSGMLVKTVFFIPIFIFGHTLNIGINLIGTYVHTNRLQYVEFFSKFYEGGGRSFTPLTAKITKYFNLKEETYNG